MPGILPWELQNIVNICCQKTNLQDTRKKDITKEKNVAVFIVFCENNKRISIYLLLNKYMISFYLITPKIQCVNS